MTDYQLQLYWALHEMEYLKHIDRAIKVRHPIVSHFYYHGGEIYRIPTPKHSMIFLIHNVCHDFPEKYVEILEKLGYGFEIIGYEHSGLTGLHKAASTIAKKVMDKEGSVCCHRCRV